MHRAFLVGRSPGQGKRLIPVVPLALDVTHQCHLQAQLPIGNRAPLGLEAPIAQVAYDPPPKFIGLSRRPVFTAKTAFCPLQPAQVALSRGLPPRGTPKARPYPILGLFAHPPQKGTFQQYASIMAGSAFVQPSDVLIVLGPFENDLLRHRMRHENLRVTEGAPFETSHCRSKCWCPDRVKA